MPTQRELYDEGIKRCNKFLTLNGLSLPRYLLYSDAVEQYDKRLVERTTKFGRTIGMATGIYTRSSPHGPTVYVNLNLCAQPVQVPGFRRWSWPCWKTDRTPMGVVAHEVGHHVTEEVSKRFDDNSRAACRIEWLRVIKGKKVTSYEPVPDEAGAETLRLFILNPNLLRWAIPKRYEFLTKQLGLKPSERRAYPAVLGNANYIGPAERWIG